jgi:LmbE family N-acetylglucosaminyl deacetylase
MPKSSPKRLLVIGAHPDDETFGSGGTIALEVARGSEVTVCCLTGSTSRHAELTAACKVLGAKSLLLKGQDLTLRVSEVAKALIPIIQKIKPHVIISHSDIDYHPDHRVVHKAFLRATEWAGHSTQYQERAWRPQRLYSMEINNLLAEPTVLVNVTESIDKKRKAIAKYQSQLEKTSDYYQSFNLQKARLRGVQGDCEYAEAFQEILMPVHGPFYNPTPTVKTIF